MVDIFVKGEQGFGLLEFSCLYVVIGKFVGNASNWLAKWKSRIVEFKGESDHVHLLIDYNPKVQISKFVNNLKTVSSRLIRKEFEEQLKQVYSKPVFWSGAYFVASCGGVTGALDPVQNREEFLSTFQSLTIPIMIVIGEQSPSQSKAEMEVLAALPNIQIQRLPGSLGLHEEYATEVASTILPLLLS